MRAGSEAVAVDDRDLPDGAEVRSTTEDADLAAAVRSGFAAQLVDHGNDAKSADHTEHEAHRQE